MKKLLITGFDPFGGESINPAWEAVKLLPDQIGDWILTKQMIPTVFGTAAQTVLETAAELEPDVILCIGQAGGRSAVTPERIGINVRDARISDNAGNQPTDQPIVPEGPDGLFSPLPIKSMVEAIAAEGISAAVSNSAGAVVCNDVLYTLLHHYHMTSCRVGFIHVPFLPEQGTPSLPLADTVRALTAAIGVL